VQSLYYICRLKINHGRQHADIGYYRKLKIWFSILEIWWNSHCAYRQSMVCCIHFISCGSLFYYVTISSHMHIRRNLKLTWNFSQSESIIGYNIHVEIPSRTTTGDRWHKTMTIRGQYLVHINEHHHNPGTGWYIDTIVKDQPRTVTSAKFG
jgi:hypothetical protein